MLTEQEIMNTIDDEIAWTRRWNYARALIFRRNILFFYRTPAWRDMVYAQMCKVTDGRDIVHIANMPNNYKWELCLNHGVNLICVPEHEDNVRGMKGDVLIFEEGTPREWINWCVAETRSYDNGKNYILSLDGNLTSAESEVPA